MKKLTLFLTLAVAMANMPVSAMNRATAEDLKEFRDAVAEGKKTTARKTLDSVTVGAQTVKNTTLELARKMVNPAAKLTAGALTIAAAVAAYTYWRDAMMSSYVPYVAPTCFDAANMGTACQTAADICGVCEPYVMSFWEALRNIKFGC